MRDWLIKTIAYFAERPDLQLLIRVHPAEVRGALPSRQPVVAEIAAAFPKLPPNVFVIPPESQVSTYAAMMMCDSVVIFGTKTGVELTSFGIPIIVAGEAWIRHKGMTIDVSSEAEYRQALNRLPLKQRNSADIVQRARKYAYHFFFRRMIPLPFMQSNDKGGFDVGIKSLDELMPGAHPGLDVICDGILNGTPFIYPAEKLGIHDE
jgi:hypothetical protein